MAEQPENGKSTASYTVVARRYRPQAFQDLVGQPHVITALSNAIEQHRVGHAYLFTGARGVGKTSTARIFAKCLNCLDGPTTTPCNECEVCRSVSVGEDVDVIEIDGASNRGIDEIRQLRSNANVRPSRCRYKIYIIDEVHMLTVQAFNALLKTLEEPPDHVKFLFCTTDPHKIPITVLSRCQRFDFAPVEADEITKRLQEICDKEGVQADSDALELIARRANGSMRDSQSLLEQILSFCDQSISLEDVHRLLGTADMGNVAKIVQAMISKQMPETMQAIDETVKRGVEVGQLAQQVVGYLRDLMAAKVGCEPNLLLHVSGSELKNLQKTTGDVGLDSIFAMLQIMDQCCTRMQHSHHSRILLEAAALRCCEIQDLQSISDLVSNLSGNAPPAKKKATIVADMVAPAPKTTSPIESIQKNSETHIQPSPAISPAVEANKASVAVAEQNHAVENKLPTDSLSASIEPLRSTGHSQRTDNGERIPTPKLESAWKETLEELGGMTADFGADYERIEMVGASQVKVMLKSAYNVDLCNRPERRSKFEEAMSSRLRKRIAISFAASEQARSKQIQPSEPRLTRFQKMRNYEKHPFVKNAIEMFQGEMIDIREIKRIRDEQ
ncbi:MAG: DNA polymerase III subunit gamma/tau [Pirellulaceae bacterium]